MTTQQPSWLFPPTNGGQEYATSAAANFFASDTLQKAVRELLQNSLDNPASHDEPVHVTFRRDSVLPDDIGAVDLSRHLKAASEQAQLDQNQLHAVQYAEMAKLASQPAINVLAVTDTNTTGLPPEQWRKLIRLEGSPTQPNGNARGGSYGLGKNAPFNLSAINTVFYTSIWTGDDHTSHHQSIGKAQLATHKNPDTPEETLQHIGFYAFHNPQPNTPLADLQIPTCFQIKHQGTAIYVIAFRDDLIPTWAHQTARAAAGSFFHAIHHGTLTVDIIDAPHNGFTLNRETLPTVMQKHFPDARARHYLQAITHEDITHSHAHSADNPIRKVSHQISFNPRAPKRLALINSRGMLITDERRSNPFYPDGNLGLNDWCIVAAPSATDGSDTYVRRFEPPAHDAIDLNLVEVPHELPTKIRANFHEHRDNIEDALHLAAGQAAIKLDDNVSELAELLPDQDPTDEHTDYVNEAEAPDHEQTSSVSTETQSPPAPGGNKEDPPPGPSDPPSFVSLQGRAYLQDNDQIALVFNTPHTQHPEITIHLYTAGEQTTRSEDRIPILDISSYQGLEQPPALTDDSNIRIASTPNQPVAITVRIPPQDALYHGYEIVAQQIPT